MNINIKATHTTVTDAIRSSIHDKLLTIEPFLKSEEHIFVELFEDTKHQTGQFSRVEINIKPHGVYAEAFGNDFYEALDLVVPKVKDQLLKRKEKKLSLRKRFGSILKRFR